MKKFIIFIVCFYSSPIFSQSLSFEKINTDIDTVISVFSGIHPAFNGSSNKQSLYALRNTIDNHLYLKYYLNKKKSRGCKAGYGSKYEFK
jgi:hypothetical protein